MAGHKIVVEDERSPWWRTLTDRLLDWWPELALSVVGIAIGLLSPLDWRRAVTLGVGAAVAARLVAVNRALRAADAYAWWRDMSWDPWKAANASLAAAGGRDAESSHARVVANMQMIETLVERLRPSGLAPVGLRVDRDKSQPELWDNAGVTSFGKAGLLTVGSVLLMASPPAVAAVVLHELHHLRRRDVSRRRVLYPLCSGALSAVAAMGSFVVLGWLLAGLLIFNVVQAWSTELACDRAAVAAGSRQALRARFLCSTGWRSVRPSLSHPPPLLRAALMRFWPERSGPARTVVNGAVARAMSPLSNCSAPT